MRTLALIMAGGQGTRLFPLTRDRAKPAVPFGGKYRIVDFVPDIVAVFGADHIYRMDINHMIEFHLEHKASVSVATLPVLLEEADQFGVLEVDSGMRVFNFDEKPSNPRAMPGAPGKCLASMGNYLFDPQVLRNSLIEDAANHSSRHDFGRDLIPALIQRVPVYAYNFMTNHIRGDSEENL